MTHVDSRGEARMVDVAGKEITLRAAVAAGRVVTTRDVLDLLRGRGVPKGDALGVARLAGIMAAKRTPDLIPLCHPIAIHGVTVDLTVTDDGVDIRATVRTADRTGVEMEALTSVAAAGLALIDMIKAVDPAASIDGVRVLRKEGGKTGLWEREAMPALSRQSPAPNLTGPDTGPPRVVVIVASTRAATGVYEDRGGPLLADGLRAFGCEVGDVVVVPDGAPVREALRAALDTRPDAIVTTGGTGISPTDRTPDMTRELLDYEVPGIADAVRGSGATPLAALSRGVTGVAGRTLVVNLPGSTGGVRDGLTVLAQVLPHAVEQLRGADHPASATRGTEV
ncbi:bifunctional molybdenum cofactor biosynthesis protein MoaC/MoaB [Catellatospora methionotrophica]|nr:bifunctional molybdenum cofactor biosynthesis protein MoaC/MoaB [Catellatospora methionotrophica]